MPKQMSGELDSVVTTKSGSDLPTYDKVTGNGPVISGGGKSNKSLPKADNVIPGGTSVPDNSGTDNASYVLTMADTKITGNG
jgi:hypothetical protein